MIYSRLLILAALFFCMSCHLAGKNEPVGKAEPTWSGQMQNMAQGVKQLMPFLYSREAFNDPKNHAKIVKYLSEFSESSQHVKPDMGKKYLGDDLLVDYALSNLQESLTRALRSFESGQLDYSRSVAKASLNYCFQCHSVTHEGSSAAWDLDQLQQLNLAPLEKADLLVATRKYDKALTYMEGLLSSEDFLKNYAFDFESLLRRYLALIIRVENAPTRALKELNKILNHGDTPHYIVEQAEGWRASLATWQKERKPDLKTASALFAQVEKHYARAAGIQHYEKDHAGDVEYLRATELLHQGMKLLKAPSDKAHALFLLGRAYEVLDELGSWNLHETYYEACIDTDPSGSLASRCYGRLEASLIMGYSGSSGTHLPTEEKERLKRLKAKLGAH